MTDSELMARVYWRVKRHTPESTSLPGAIRDHAQACGVIAFLFDVHPDTVARAVNEYDEDRIRETDRAVR